MNFYSFGKQENPIIFLLPGTCCHWEQNFSHVIPLLERDFYVVCVSYDGFDEREDTTFPDMLTETEKMEDYIRINFNGHIHAAYGCSMGGSFVGLLIQRGKIHIDHGILGSSDMDQETGLSARFKAWLIAKILCGIMKKGRLPGWMQKCLNRKSPEERAYMDQMLKMFGFGTNRMAFIKEESIRNQFYSDLITPLENGISAPDTAVHIFYAVKMGAQYEGRYQQHFQNPDIRRHDMQHEELLVRYPEEWAAEIRRCCGIIREGE